MEEIVILNELQRKYGLRENEIAILKLLLSTKNNLKALEVSKQTGIPMGRIYDFLNELVVKQLVSRTDETPTRYFIENFEQRVYDFLNYQFDVDKKRCLAILAALEKQKKLATAGVKVVYTNEEFVLELIRQCDLGENFKVLLLGLSVPYFMYPEDKEGFAKMRSLVVSKRGALTGVRTTALQTLMNDSFNKRHHMKKKSEFVISEGSIKIFLQTLEKNYSKQFVKDHLEYIKKRIKTENIRANILNEEFPYYISGSDKNFILGARTGEEIVGIVFDGAHGARLSAKLFDHLFAEGKDINIMLNKYLNTGKI